MVARVRQSGGVEITTVRKYLGFWPWAVALDCGSRLPLSPQQPAAEPKAITNPHPRVLYRLWNLSKLDNLVNYFRLVY